MGALPDLALLRRERQSSPSTINEISRIVIGAAIKIHRRLGPGLLESAYEACLAHELTTMGLRVDRQKAVPLFY